MLHNNIDDRIKDLLSELTLTEKASLCSGFDFWNTKSIKRLNIPSIMFADGPHGLRKENNEDTDNVGMKASFPATSFPPAVNLASSWNPELVEEVGVALAEQCLDQEVSTILGPGTNIKRSPLCGRNFEYFSEDPYLASKMCISYTNGVQSLGIGTSIKHFAVNNQESQRMTIDAIVDERALREIYLFPFEEAIRRAQPWSVMCSYNKLNGTYLSDNKRLLTDILRKEWGFNGVVVSDWNATNNRIEGIKAGMDIEMPSCGGRTDKEIVKAVVSGQLLESELNTVVERILQFIMNCYLNIQPDFVCNYEKAHELARKVANESMVLLKNDNNILPIKNFDDLCVIGALAKESRYQGSGSSRINPYKLIHFTDYLKAKEVKFSYSDGYTLSDSGYSEKLLNDAVAMAKNKKQVIVFVGLTDAFEAEGYDRSHLDLPSGQIKLIEEISKVNPNAIFVLFGGSPIRMPWLPNVSTLLNAYLPGEAVGESVYDILFGKVNPSGKLAETYPISLESYLGSKYYKGGPKTTEHRESIYVGYRYYDTAKKDVLFPFGYGLSYTTFEYSDLVLSDAEIDVNSEILLVSFNLKNTGNVDGAEICQLYVKPPKSNIFKEEKKLRAFQKVFLKAGETATITMQVSKRGWAYYNTEVKDWHIESGNYEVLIGSSSRDIRLSETIKIVGNYPELAVPDFTKTAPSYYNLENAEQIDKEEFEAVFGKPMPPNSHSKRGEFDRNTTVDELRCCLVGKVFMKIAPSLIKDQMPSADQTAMIILQQGMLEMPMRALSGVTSGLLEERVTDGLILWGNKKRMKGLRYIVTGLIKSLKNIRRMNLQNKIAKEKFKNKEEQKRLKEEHKQIILEQKEALKELKDGLKSIQDFTKRVDDSELPIKHIEYQKQNIKEIKLNLKTIKLNAKDERDNLKKEQRDEIIKIKELEKLKKKNIKASISELEDSGKDETKSLKYLLSRSKDKDKNDSNNKKES